MAAELADLQLPHMAMLHLMGADLTAVAVSELARADWPSLKLLSFGHDDLDAVAVLLGVDLEKAVGTKQVYHRRVLSLPDMGFWPNLSQITILKSSVHLSQ